MLKEIPGACTHHQAEVIAGLALSYPVTVEIAPYAPQVVTPENIRNDTWFLIQEQQEGVINAFFYRAIAQLLQEVQEHANQRLAEVNTQPVVETVPTALPIQNAPTGTIWSRFMSFLKPESKQLTHSDRGAH